MSKWTKKNLSQSTPLGSGPLFLLLWEVPWACPSHTSLLFSDSAPALCARLGQSFLPHGSRPVLALFPFTLIFSVQEPFLEAFIPSPSRIALYSTWALGGPQGQARDVVDSHESNWGPRKLLLTWLDLRCSTCLMSPYLCLLNVWQNMKESILQN